MEEIVLWESVRDELIHTQKESSTPNVKFGSHWSYNFRNDPKRFAFVLARYKHAMKLAGKRKAVLELGCSEGIGATIAGELCEQYVGIDYDTAAIEAAKKNFPSSKFSFISQDFMNQKIGKFDCILSLDVIEHIYKEHEGEFIQTIYDNLSEDGIAIIGTPNITSEAYASEASKLGHVNLYSQERLSALLETKFVQVFNFCLNDEIFHTGFPMMGHYLLSAAFIKR